jgi:hypothetical protein
MMIPSIVSALRSLLTRRARVAVRAFSRIIRISRIAGNRPEWDGPAKVAVPSVNYFMASMPAWAIWASCCEVTPDTPTEPMILPSTTMGMADVSRHFPTLNRKWQISPSRTT